MWRSRLTTTEIADIEAWIDHQLDSNELITTSWLPGHDWSGTVLDVIYWKACRQDQVAAAKCFGLFVWDCVLRRKHELWGSKHCEKDGYPIKGRTYFRLLGAVRRTAA